MEKQNFSSVDEYIASQPEALRMLLEDVRRAIRKTVPQADEVIAYRMPTYKLNDRVLLHFAGWKRHYSLYPITEPIVSAFGKELAPYEVNEKGTARFPLSQPVPVKLIEKIAKFRAKEIAKR
jgi:uncharacterized protein YdhG (YjbR/CyaY superfamily)